MTLTERLAQTQAQRQQIEDQIAAYDAEIRRLTPQLWAVRGQEALLIELTREEPVDA